LKKQKGQLSIEALFVLLIFLFVIAQIISIQTEHGRKVLENIAETRNFAETEKCAIAIDAMSSNPGAIAGQKNTGCYGNGSNKIFFERNGIAQSTTMALEIHTIQQGENPIVRLENDSHYIE